MHVDDQLLLFVLFLAVSWWIIFSGAINNIKLNFDSKNIATSLAVLCWSNSARFNGVQQETDISCVSGVATHDFRPEAIFIGPKMLLIWFVATLLKLSNFISSTFGQTAVIFCHSLSRQVLLHQIELFLGGDIFQYTQLVFTEPVAN